ncbi:hypothetical protein VTO42DRAFT_3438 [Malbranchea cinnamomea]
MKEYSFAPSCAVLQSFPLINTCDLTGNIELSRGKGASQTSTSRESFNSQIVRLTRTITFGLLLHNPSSRSHPVDDRRYQQLRLGSSRESFIESDVEYQMCIICSSGMPALASTKAFVIPKRRFGAPYCQ